MSQPLPMPLTQAVALAACLVDFEIEQPQVTPPPPGWMDDLTAAQQTLKEFLAEINPIPHQARLTPQQSRAEIAPRRGHRRPRGKPA